MVAPKPKYVQLQPQVRSQKRLQLYLAPTRRVGMAVRGTYLPPPNYGARTTQTLPSLEKKRNPVGALGAKGAYAWRPRGGATWPR